jgi:hypothetical protein
MESRFRSAMIRVASCSADISSEKKPTMPPSTVRCAVGARLAAQALAML